MALALPERELLREGTLHVRPGDRIALVGRNGAGKTTLLDVMAGDRHPDEGSLWRRNDLKIGYLRQESVLGSPRTVWEEARLGMDRVNGLRSRLERAQEEVQEGRPGAIERYDQVMEIFRVAGGFSADETIGEVLHGLGFARDDWHRPCSTFSGGWQVRVALARLLLSDADLLLLDEPTNHLDFMARTWLARHLAAPETAAGTGVRRAEPAVVVVSHDRYLLDRACRRVVEIRDARLHVFTGNLSAWLKEREVRRRQEEEAFEAQQREVERLERFVERFRAKATKASQARSRQRELDKMERLTAPVAEHPPRLRLPPPPHSSFQVVSLRKATVAWPDGPPVLQKVDLEVTRGMRLAVVGPNGGGKTTLALALAGRLPVSSGSRILGEGVRCGVFSQDMTLRLDPTLSAVDHVLALAPFSGPQQVRSILGALGLPGDMATRPVGGLSGGEKARVALAGFVVQPHNLLVLDEPTNHLDAMTVDVLAQALAGWQGALVMVTHDRYLAQTVATHAALVRDGGLVFQEGVGEEIFEGQKPVPARPAQPEAPRSRDPSEEGSWEDRKRQARERERIQRRIAAIEAQIEAFDARIGEVDAQLSNLGSDYHRVAGLARERQETETARDQLYDEWARLEESLR